METDGVHRLVCDGHLGVLNLNGLVVAATIVIENDVGSSIFACDGLGVVLLLLGCHTVVHRIAATGCKGQGSQQPKE